MTTFKEIRGTAIQSVSSDPTTPELGQIWYNNTIGVLKGYDLTLATWAAGGNMNTARRLLAGAGTQTAGLGAGGETTTSVANTEEWSGPQTTATASTLTTS